MVIDTSALAAIVWKEPEGDAFLEALAAAPVRLLSSVTALESAIVVQGRYGRRVSIPLELLLLNVGVETVPFDVKQAEVAIRAWRKYGKGNHPARLNLGDCCVYALAKVTSEPILCKGADFSQTDIAVVDLR